MAPFTHRTLSEGKVLIIPNEPQLQFMHGAGLTMPIVSASANGCLNYENDLPSFMINAQEHLDPIGRSGSDHGGLVKGEGEDGQWIIGDPDLLHNIIFDTYQNLNR